jgi:hypothetical protein
MVDAIWYIQNSPDDVAGLEESRFMNLVEKLGVHDRRKNMVGACTILQKSSATIYFCTIL